MAETTSAASSGEANGFERAAALQSPGRTTVKVLDSPPGPWWDILALLARRPSHRLGLVKLQQESGATPFFLLAERNGVRVGGLSGFIVGSRRFPLLDPLFARTVLLLDEPMALESPLEVVPALVNALEELLLRRRVVSLRWRVEWRRHLDPQWLRQRGYTVRPHGAAILELPTDPGAVEEHFSRATGKQVRKAERSGVRVEVTTDVRRLIRLLDCSFERSGLPHRSHSYVRRAYELLGGEVLVAHAGGPDIAALLWFPFGETAQNAFHGRRDGDTHGASHLLHRELMRRAIARGIRWLHTGDAALPGIPSPPGLAGITQFKEGLGFQVEETFSAHRTLRPIAWRLLGGGRALWAHTRALSARGLDR